MNFDDEAMIKLFKILENAKVTSEQVNEQIRTTMKLSRLIKRRLSKFEKQLKNFDERLKKLEY
jgi:hypothetical protein